MRGKLLRLAYGLLYNQLAWAYDLAAWLVSAGQWRDWGRTVLGQLSGRRVLEIAFGPGHLLGDIARSGYEVVGLDRSPAMVRLAARNNPGRGSKIIRGDARALPFAPNTFDNVVLCFSGLSRDPQVIAEAARVLRDSGQVVIIDEVVLKSTHPFGILAHLLLSLTYPSHSRMLPIPFLAAGLTQKSVEIPVGFDKVAVVVGKKKVTAEPRPFGP